MKATLLQLLESNVKDQAAIQTRLLQILKGKNHVEILDTATAIREKYKDDRTQRNARLSILRVRMRRACKVLKIEAITIISKDGAFSIATVAPTHRAPKPLAIARAVAMVVERIGAHDEAVLLSLRTALLQAEISRTNPAASEELRQAA